MEKSWVFHISPEAPLPPLPRGRGLQRKRKPLLRAPRSFAFSKKRNEISSHGTNCVAVVVAPEKTEKHRVPFFWRYRLAWKLRRRFRPLASDYTIFCFPQGKKSSRHCRNPFSPLVQQKKSGAYRMDTLRFSVIREARR